MKVRCIKLIDAKRNSLESSAWLTLGKIYPVLSVNFEPKQGWLYRIRADGLNGVALFLKEEFEVVSSTIPSNWILKWEDNGVFQLTTLAWSETGFWEKFYNGEAMAFQSFQRDEEIILSADN